MRTNSGMHCINPALMPDGAAVAVVVSALVNLASLVFGESCKKRKHYRTGVP